MVVFFFFFSFKPGKNRVVARAEVGWEPPQDLPPLRLTASLGWPQAPGTAFADGQAVQGICTEKCKYTVPKHTARFSND